MSNLKFYIWTPNLDHALFTIQTRGRFEKKREPEQPNHAFAADGDLN